MAACSLPVPVTFIVGFYAFGILFLHVVPTGGGIALNRVDVVPVDLVSFRLSDLLHVAMFLPWGVIGVFCMQWQTRFRLRWAAGWILLGLLLAAGAEGVQYWLPYRSFNWSDMVFNMSGVLLGAPAMLIGPWRRKTR